VRNKAAYWGDRTRLVSANSGRSLDPKPPFGYRFGTVLILLNCSSSKCGQLWPFLWYCWLGRAVEADGDSCGANEAS
jgi:hypothetical protein